jgi:hypothetical protein
MLVLEKLLQLLGQLWSKLQLLLLLKLLHAKVIPLATLLRLLQNLRRKQQLWILRQP